MALVAAFVLGACARHEASAPMSTVVSDPAAEGATYVGSAQCRPCHEDAYAAWKTSHHDLAMQPAADSTVLGDFGNATLTYYGVTSRFFRRDGAFVVTTDGPDGKLHDYDIAYTFGVWPLQQYLVAFPGGRYQCLSLAWDSRTREEGGQRWFHLYPNERIRSNDELHWTAPDQNWNYMCAECHSTRLEKHYDNATRTYATTWSEISVGCEACHGAGSAHIEWANMIKNGKNPVRFKAMGLQVRLKDFSGGSWTFAPGAPTATHTPAWRADAQIETCARCHSRRTTVSDTYVNGKPFMDTHLPSVLEDPLYYADGQIREEDYEYASFRQSKMYHSGVACSNCHEPHAAKLRAPGDQVCAQCHAQQVFASRSHHFHKPDSAGASCTACHMPEHTYMVVDRRRDHSIRVPRPDLSVTLGTPDACTMCHTDKSDQWAADSALVWWPKLATRQHFGATIADGRAGAPGADNALIFLASDSGQPAIARATAVQLLQGYPSMRMLAAIQTATTDSDPLVRHAAAMAAEGIPPDRRYDVIDTLLHDDIRTVRAEAARVLVPIMMTSSPAIRAEIQKPLDDYIAMQHANDDRAFAHLNLGNVYAQLGKTTEAEQEFKTAIEMEPRFVPAHVNLADLYRSLGRDDDAEAVLESAVKIYPEAASLHRALGLLRTRQGRPREALAELKRAAELAPHDSDLAYVYAVALYESGKQLDALGLLERTLAGDPYNREILFALASYYRDRGDMDRALVFAKRLLALDPDNNNLAALVYQIGGGLPIGDGRAH